MIYVYIPLYGQAGGASSSVISSIQRIKRTYLKDIDHTIVAGMDKISIADLNKLITTNINQIGIDSIVSQIYLKPGVKIPKKLKGVVHGWHLLQSVGTYNQALSYLYNNPRLLRPIMLYDDVSCTATCNNYKSFLNGVKDTSAKRAIRNIRREMWYLESIKTLGLYTEDEEEVDDYDF